MIIDKATSNAVLVNSLVVVDQNGKPVKNITSFDTETLVATLSVGDPLTASEFKFEVDSPQDHDSILAIIEEEYPLIVEDTGDGIFNTRYREHDPRFVVGPKRVFSGKKGMKDDNQLPDNTLTLVLGGLVPRICTCSNCGTRFLIYIGNNDSIWSAKLAAPGDTFQTMTEVDPDTLTCDSCSEAVSIYDPA